MVTKLAEQPCLVSIHVAATKAERLLSPSEAELVAGKGIVGDRYFDKSGTFSAKDGPDREVTLIEEEALAAAARDYGVTVGGAESRRNLVTRAVPLNHLVGRRFSVGSVVLEGLKLCEPCTHLVRLLGDDKVRQALVHRGGLRARIVEGGVVRAGDVVTF